MTEHTHLLARPHRMVMDGERKIFPTGTPCTPSESQLRNMPDVFLLAGGGPTDHPGDKYGLKNKSNAQVVEAVDGIDDIELLDAWGREEHAGRRRLGAMSAIKARIEELTDRAEDEDEDKDEDGDGDGDEAEV